MPRQDLLGVPGNTELYPSPTHTHSHYSRTLCLEARAPWILRTRAMTQEG